MKNVFYLHPDGIIGYAELKVLHSTFFILHLKTKFYVKVKENIDFEVENR